jgi:hypothetical protein
MQLPEDKGSPTLPGGELVFTGLKDIAQGRYRTVEALLVFTAISRLRSLGLDIADCPVEYRPSDINLQLYHLLGKTTQEPYSQYNALRRRLASFCSVLESSTKG